MSFMLAASKPCARNTARAPSMIWRRLALSAASNSGRAIVNVSDIASLYRILRELQRRGSPFHKSLTERFGQLDIGADEAYVKRTVTEPFGQYLKNSSVWNEGDCYVPRSQGRRRIDRYHGAAGLEPRRARKRDQPASPRSGFEEAGRNQAGRSP